MTTLLNTAQAAALLNLTPGRVVQLIHAGRLPAEKLGRDWVIDPQAVAAFVPGRVGYPKGRKRK